MFRTLTRRRFLQSAAAGTALAASSLQPLAAREAGSRLRAQPLGAGLALIVGGACNVLAMGGPEGALLVDGGRKAESAAMLKLALDAVGARKLHTLVNTHWHPEQTGCNETAGGRGARIIAHENTRLWLTRRIDVDWSPDPLPALPRKAQPNKTFYTTDSIEFAGEQIAFGHLGQAHTDGDLYVHLPTANILVAGGVVSNDGWPLMDWQTGGWIGGLVGAYDRLLKIVDGSTRVIPANGPVLGRGELQAQRDMYFTIFDRLVKQLVKGMGPDEAHASGPATEFEAQWGDSKAFVLASFRSLWGHYAPDA